MLSLMSYKEYLHICPGRKRKQLCGPVSGRDGLATDGPLLGNLLGNLSVGCLSSPLMPQPARSKPNIRRQLSLDLTCAVQEQAADEPAAAVGLSSPSEGASLDHVLF